MAEQTTEATLCHCEEAEGRSGNPAPPAVTEDRPLVTFALFTYNQEKYIREAVEGALAQDYSPLEIIISDDFSTDRTFELIQEITEQYKGSHQIRINKNNKNIGLILHVETITKLALGNIIVAAAGDDISLPHRVTKIVHEFTSTNDCCYVHSAALKINDSGEVYGKYEAANLSNFSNIFLAGLSRSLALGATAAWKKSLINNFSKINKNVWAEDLIIGFRALLIGRISYIPQPLVKYRYNIGIMSKKISAHEARKRNHKIRSQRLIDSITSKQWSATLLMFGITLDSMIRLYLSVVLRVFHTNK